MNSTDSTKRAPAHTPEPWRYVDESTPAAVEMGLRDYAIESDDGGFDIASLVSSEADARRIVAAVNACRGISTESLENGVVKELLASSIRFSEAIRNHYSDAQLCLEERDAWRDAIENAMAP